MGAPLPLAAQLTHYPHGAHFVCALYMTAEALAALQSQVRTAFHVEWHHEAEPINAAGLDVLDTLQGDRP